MGDAFTRPDSFNMSGATRSHVNTAEETHRILAVLNHVRDNWQRPKSLSKSRAALLRSGNETTWKNFLAEIKDPDNKRFARFFAEDMFPELVGKLE